MRAIHRYTDEQKEFIRKVAPGRYNIEIADLFNVKFGTNLTESQIKSFKANHKIKSNVPRRRATDDDGLFTKEQKDFIKEKVKGLHNQELANLVNKKFKLSITARQMKTWKKNHGLSSELKGSEGMDPPNKGTKGVYNVGGNKTSFKKGNKPHNYMPVGSERVNGDGYVDVKIADPNIWKAKHILLWEEAYGLIPEGHCLIFLDRNRQNVSLDNLQMISRTQLAILNKNSLISDNQEITETGIIIASIYSEIGKRIKE